MLHELTIIRIKSLVLFFGPMLLPKAIAFYKSIRAVPRNGASIRPVPPNVSRALLVLCAVFLVALISTLPIFSPENVFTLTQSRLQIPNDVLFTRLSTLRLNGVTDFDNSLRSKFASLESRLLYIKYGPDAIANCLFCKPEDTSSYFYYSLPSLLAPHLFNLAILGFVTSGLMVGPEGATWRTTGIIGGMAIAAVDIWAVGAYNHQDNARATRLQDVDFFFWKMRLYRGCATAALHALIGWLMYLSSTNRAFLKPLSPSERVEGSLKLLEAARSKVNATGVMRNAVSRDPSMRAKTQNYWVNEGRMMTECMEDREVMEGVNNALENRIKIDQISSDADRYAENLVAAFANPNGPA